MAQAPPTLLEYAVTASEATQHLAVGLAHAGADPTAIKELSQCNGIFHQIIKALGSGPSLDNSAQQGQGAPPAAPEAQPGPPQPAGPPQGGPAAPAQGGSLASAAKVLMAAHAAANGPQK